MNVWVTREVLQEEMTSGTWSLSFRVGEKPRDLTFFFKGEETKDKEGMGYL